MELLIAFIASILLWLMYLGLVLLWMIDGKIKKEQVLHAFLSSVIAWTVSQIIKEIYPLPRPYHLNGRQILTLTLGHYDSSFPSTHSAIAFAIAFAIYLHTKKLGYLFLFGALLVATGRVLSNVHYFTDVLSGSLVGVLAAYLIEKLKVYRIISKRERN